MPWTKTGSLTFNTPLYSAPLAAPLTVIDHTVQSAWSGTFVPLRSSVRVTVDVSGSMRGAAHVSSFFAWNQSVAPGTSLATGKGFASGPYIADTQKVTVGSIGTSGAVGQSSRTFFVDGLTPGVPVVWELHMGVTGYYGKLNVGPTPVDLAVAPNGRRLYVTCHADTGGPGGGVAVVDPAQSFNDEALAVKLAHLDFPFPFGIAVHPTNPDLIYVQEIGGQVREVNPNTGAVVRSWAVAGFNRLVVEETGAALYIIGDNFFRAVNLSTGVLAAPVTVGNGSASGRSVQIGGFLYIPCATQGRVDRVNLANGVVTSLGTGGSTNGYSLTRTPDSTRLWLVQRHAASQRLREIDVASFTFTGVEITGLGELPQDAQVSKTGRSVIVATGSSTTAQFQSYVLPPKGVRYESGSVTALDGVTVEQLARMVTAPEGSIYALGTLLHYWHGSELIITPGDEFWNAHGDVTIENAQNWTP